jgi:hypothetical protein
MKNKIILSGLLSFVVLSLAVLVSLTVQNHTEAQTTTSSNDEATVVQLGQLTDKEREYSKEFNKLYPFREGRKFREIIEEDNRAGKEAESISGFLGEHESFYLPGAARETPQDFLNRLACGSDAIVIGDVKSKSSHVTEDEKLIYTTNEFLVQSILKNSSTSPFQIGKVIEVARSGGIVQIDKRRIKIDDYSYEPLKISNRYLLFLRFVPGAEGYVAASPEGDFMLDGDSYRKLARRPVPESLEGKNDSRELSDSVSAAIKAGCKKN